MTITRTIRTLCATLALIGGALVAAAPGAVAAPTGIAVSDGFGLGFLQYGTGCTYTVTVRGDHPGALWDQGGGTFGPVTQEEPGVFTADWTPHATGKHLLSAGAVSTEVNVVTGRDLGLVCVAVPPGLRLPS